MKAISNPAPMVTNNGIGGRGVMVKTFLTNGIYGMAKTPSVDTINNDTSVGFCLNRRRGLIHLLADAMMRKKKLAAIKPHNNTAARAADKPISAQVPCGSTGR